MAFSVNTSNYQAVLDSFKSFADSALAKADGRKGDTIARFDDHSVSVDVTNSDKIGSWFRSADNQNANDHVRDVFREAIKMKLGAQDNKTLARLIGDDLKWDDFVARGRPLSARRINAILTSVDRILNARAAVPAEQEIAVEPNDDEAQKLVDDYFAGVSPESAKAESESLVRGLGKFERRRAEAIVGTKSEKSIAEDKKMLRRIKPPKPQPTTTVEDEVGGLGTALLTPLSAIVGSLTDREGKRARMIVGSGVDGNEVDIQSQIDEDSEIE